MLDLGVALGQNHAFGLIAGRCPAAQAAGLRRLREEKLYKRCAENWRDFCPQYLKMSRSEVDRGLWQEADVAVRTERLNECSAAVVAEFEKISREEGLGLAREI